ncbi:MAG: ATP-dependent helicase [Planctomycetota bacterium]
MSDLVADLNAAQREAVEHGMGPLLVVAGPGTGKTRTLTRRIAYLIRERGVDPASIAAITFTNRAAGEMRERLAGLLAGQAETIGFVGTFHALGLEMIRREFAQLGLNREPVLYGEEDQQALCREVLHELNPGHGRASVEKILSSIESCLNRDIPVAGEVEGFAIDEVYGAFTRRKREEDAVDFTDLLVLPLKLFNESAVLPAKYGKIYRHLFVDEYQDVNWLQVQMTRHLGGGAESLMAIGDPDQAIYSFRGSDVKNFLNFPDTFPGARVLHLSRNYRSSATILSASGQVICKNHARLETAEPSKAVGGQGLRIDQRRLATDRAEAVFVCRAIERLAGGIGRYGMVSGSWDREPQGSLPDGEPQEYGFGDMAILYRLNAQAKPLCDALDKAGIPYQRVGTGERGSNPYERFVLAATRLSLAPDNRAAWRIMKQFQNSRKNRGGEGRMPDQGYADLLQAPASDGLQEENPFLRAAWTFAKAMPDDADALLRAAESLTEQASGARGDLHDFLAGAPLAHREDPFDARAQKVTLSSIHASKGLEFPVVFIVGLEEGIVPYFREDEPFPAAALEEERRLLYVGMTRARSELYLTHTQKRFLFGKQLNGQPSPFLKDISKNLISFIQEHQRQKKPLKDQNKQQQSLF